jgi:hypothetical protein
MENLYFYRQPVISTAPWWRGTCQKARHGRCQRICLLIRRDHCLAEAPRLRTCQRSAAICFYVLLVTHIPRSKRPSFLYLVHWTFKRHRTIDVVDSLAYAEYDTLPHVTHLNPCVLSPMLANFCQRSTCPPSLEFN